MRLTICLEGNNEGRVLASVDMEEIVKMTITDDIEKSNFNPQMLKSCTDTSYQCGYQQGYQQGRTDAIREVIDLLHEYRAIDCECCPANKSCEKDDYCELVITKFLDYMKNNGE